MVRPILEYANVIYDNCTLNESNLLETVQFDAARVCTGALWNTSKVKVLKEVGWESLAVRRRFSKYVMFFKVINKFTPPYVCTIPLPSVYTVVNYNLRNSGDIYAVRGLELISIKTPSFHPL